MCRDVAEIALGPILHGQGTTVGQRRYEICWIAPLSIHFPPIFTAEARTKLSYSIADLIIIVVYVGHHLEHFEGRDLIEALTAIAAKIGVKTCTDNVKKSLIPKK